MLNNLKNKIYRYAVKRGWIYSPVLASAGYYSEQDEHKKELLLSTLHKG